MLQTLHRPRIDRRIASSVAFGLAAAFVLTLTACGPSSPTAKVTAARAEYTVRLENFTANLPEPIDELSFDSQGEEGAAAEASEAVAEASAAAAEESTGSDEAGEAPMDEEAVMAEASTPEIILHLLVQFKGREPLPGITVEVTRQDPFGDEKEPTLHWIETGSMAKNDIQQVDLKLEDAEYEEGDAYSVLLRQIVPPEDHARYREYAEAGP